TEEQNVLANIAPAPSVQNVNKTEQQPQKKMKLEPTTPDEMEGIKKPQSPQRIMTRSQRRRSQGNVDLIEDENKSRRRKHKSSRVGDRYQCVVPPLSEMKTKLDKNDEEMGGELIWKPELVDEKRLKEYISFCEKIEAKNQLLLDRAFIILHKFDYDFELAENFIKDNPEEIIRKDFTIEEKNIVKEGIKKYGKELHPIS